MSIIEGSLEVINAENVKKKALEVGFISSGISSPEMLQELPYGLVEKVIDLKSPKEELPDVKAVILLAYYAWDKAFNLAVDSTYFRDQNKFSPKVPLERYQLYYEILKNKAWTIVDYLSKRGEKALL